MKKNLTELVFIIDRSGSMAGLESDTIGGFNSMIEKQKKEDGQCLVSTVLFNQKSSVLYDRVDINDIKKMEDNDYIASGSTALIDAMGDAIKHIKTVHKYIREEDVPENTIFMITTDGYENASSKYSSDEVKKMVEKQKEEGWEFLFLAANIDAVETAKSYGISEDRATNYVHDSVGSKKSYGAFAKAVSSIRNCKELCPDWNAEVVEDYNKRNSK